MELSTEVLTALKANAFSRTLHYLADYVLINKR